MQKVYKSRIYRILVNLVFGIAAAGVVYLVAGIWLEPFLRAAVGIGILVLYLWLVILDNLITITVDGQYMTVKKGHKLKRFEIARSSFYAKMVSSSGDTSCTLQITDENGKVEYVDCELIGVGQFRKLLEDIGVTGGDAPVQKLQTKKGE